MTFEEFLDWVPLNPGSWEFHAGEIVAMAGGGGTTRNHDDLVVRLTVALGNHLGRGAPCRVQSGGLAVRVEANDCVHFPDLHVTCDPVDHADDRTTRSPSLIIEVLSESTRDYDQGDKFASYKCLDSLREYLLVDASAQSVTLHRRVGARRWQSDEFGPEDSFTLETIALTIDVSDLYAHTDVPLPRPRPRLVASDTRG